KAMKPRTPTATTAPTASTRTSNSFTMHTLCRDELFRRGLPALRRCFSYVDFAKGHFYSADMPRSAARSRIDALLVERGLVQSRQQAQAILMAGDIRVDGATVTRPGALVAAEAAIEVLRRPRFV